MKRKLIVFGNNGFAEMVAYYFETYAAFEVVAFTAHEKFISVSRLNDRPLLPFETIASEFAPAEHAFFVALEHGRQNLARAEIAAEASSLGYDLASFVSPSAQVSAKATLGHHCLVLENAVIQHGVEMGSNNIVLANGFFGQSCRVGADNYFGSGFFADRHVRLGSNSIFGSHVRVAESLVIGDWAHIRAFETLKASLPLPTIIHPTFRTSGHIIDRRQPAL